MLKKQEKRQRRHRKIRGKISGTSKVPRLSVFRSAKQLYAQLIDDEKGKVLVAASSREFKKSKKQTKNDKKTEKDKKLLSAKVAVAYRVGELIAEKALEKKIEKAVFDRGGYKYHGRVKAFAEGARKGGLKF